MAWDPFADPADDIESFCPKDMDYIQACAL